MTGKRKRGPFVAGWGNFSRPSLATWHIYSEERGGTLCRSCGHRATAGEASRQCCPSCNFAGVLNPEIGALGVVEAFKRLQPLAVAQTADRAIGLMRGDPLRVIICLTCGDAWGYAPHTPLVCLSCDETVCDGRTVSVDDVMARVFPNGTASRTERCVTCEGTGKMRTGAGAEVYCLDCDGTGMRMTIPANGDPPVPPVPPVPDTKRPDLSGAFDADVIGTLRIILGREPSPGECNDLESTSIEMWALLHAGAVRLQDERNHAIADLDRLAPREARGPVRFGPGATFATVAEGIEQAGRDADDGGSDG